MTDLEQIKRMLDNAGEEYEEHPRPMSITHIGNNTYYDAGGTNLYFGWRDYAHAGMLFGAGGEFTDIWYEGDG